MVGWDGDSKAVTLQSVDSLIVQSGATYTLMDRLLKYQNEFAAKKHAISGNFDLNVSMPSSEDTAAVPLKVSGMVTGLVSQNDTEISLNMKSNASAFAASQIGGDELDEEAIPLLSLLDEFDLKMIVNSRAGMIYMQMPLLSAVSGQSPDAWLSMDTSQMTSELQTNVLNSQFWDVTSFKEYISSTLKSICLYDDGINASDINEMLAMLNSLFSDQAFVREGDNYVSIINPNE